MSKLQRASLYVAGFAVFASGLAWLGLHYFGSPSGEMVFARNPMEPWALRLHGAAAMAILVVLGALLPTHVRPAWRNRLNVATGLSMLNAAGVLVLTGWGLYYVGDEALRAGLSLAHWLVGIAALPLLVVHIGLGRAARRETL